MRQSIKYIIPGAFALLLALAVACGSPAATPENTPPPIGHRSAGAPDRNRGSPTSSSSDGNTGTDGGPGC